MPLGESYQLAQVLGHLEVTSTRQAATWCIMEALGNVDLTNNVSVVNLVPCPPKGTLSPRRRSVYLCLSGSMTYTLDLLLLHLQ
jgi:hypothetical protein